MCDTEKVKIMSPQWNYKEATKLKGKYTHNFLEATELFKTDCSITLGEEDIKYGLRVASGPRSYFGILVCNININLF